MAKPIRVAFICTGNLCRSPMAAALAEALLRQAGYEPMVISGGTLGLLGRPAAEGAIRAMKKRGLDIGGHRSQGVPLALLEHADHLVVMAPRHRRHLLEIAPSLGPQIVNLWEFGPSHLNLSEIPDPVGQPDFVFEKVCTLIAEALQKWVSVLGSV